CERHVRPHRPRLYERHPPERPDHPDAGAGGRGPDHDRNDDAGVPRGLRVTPFALSALKYVLFALLFLFVWRSMRWAVRGITVEPSPTGRKARKSVGAVPVPTGPSAVVVHPPEGKA